MWPRHFKSRKTGSEKRENGRGHTGHWWQRAVTQYVLGSARGQVSWKPTVPHAVWSWTRDSASLGDSASSSVNWVLQGQPGETLWESLVLSGERSAERVAGRLWTHIQGWLWRLDRPRTRVLAKPMDMTNYTVPKCFLLTWFLLLMTDNWKFLICHNYNWLQKYDKNSFSYI